MKWPICGGSKKLTGWISWASALWYTRREGKRVEHLGRSSVAGQLALQVLDSLALAARQQRQLLALGRQDAHALLQQLRAALQDVCEGMSGRIPRDELQHQRERTDHCQQDAHALLQQLRAALQGVCEGMSGRMP